MAERQLNGMGMAGAANGSRGARTASLEGRVPRREANLVQESVDYDVVVPTAMATVMDSGMECARISAERIVT
jgi:hypothetical protein